MEKYTGRRLIAAGAAVAVIGAGALGTIKSSEPEIVKSGPTAEYYIEHSQEIADQVGQQLMSREPVQFALNTQLLVESDGKFFIVNSPMISDNGRFFVWPSALAGAGFRALPVREAEVYVPADNEESPLSTVPAIVENQVAGSTTDATMLAEAALFANTAEKGGEHQVVLRVNEVPGRDAAKQILNGLGLVEADNPLVTFKTELNSV